MGQPEREEGRIRQVYARRDSSGKAALYHWQRQDVIYMVYRDRAVLAHALQCLGINDLSLLHVLDVGCGSGGWLRLLLEWGASPERLHGVDLLPDRIARAQALSPAGVDWRVGNAVGLDFADSSMDLCAASTVFSSILDPAARLALAQEMARVVKPGGYIMIQDYVVSAPTNPDTVGIPQREIRRLFPAMRQRHSFKLIFPPPLLRLLPQGLLWLAHLCEVLLPFICTHRLFVLQKPLPDMDPDHS
jgi:SAM-dependent methyltransferase